MLFPIAACNDSNGANDTPGLKYKKINGVYTVYDYVQEDGVTELDIGAKLPVDVTDVRIKKGAFEGNSQLQKIIVSDKITTIDEGAFQKMGALVSLELPFVGKNANSDVTLGETKKDEDKSVDSQRTIAHLFGTEEYDAGVAITVYYNENDSVTCYVPVTFKEVIVNATTEYSIPMYAFNGAVNLTAITIKGKIDEIGEYAFAGVKELTTAYIPATVTTIRVGAFKNCAKLATLKIEVGSTLSKVEKEAFVSTKIKDTAFDGILTLTDAQKADIFGE